MVNRDLIRHILKEETRDTKLELIRQIKDEGLYSVANLIGGLDNLKKIFKDNPEMVERIENQKGLVKVSWTMDGDDPSIVLPFKIIGTGWNIWMTNAWPIVNIIYNENTLTEDENHKFKDFLYDSFHDESSVRVLKLNSDEPRMHKTYVQLGEINGKTRQQNTTDLSRSYDLSDIRDIVETLGDDNILKEEIDNTKDIQKNLRVINILLNQVSWKGLCDIWVEYNPVDRDYEIRSKSTQRHFDHNEITKELNHIDNTLRSMGLIIYIFTPWYVEDCEDEVKFMNESINKSDEKRNIYLRESIDKSENKNIKLVKDIIYNMYDNVRFVEYIDKRNEIMVYYTNHDNRQMLIPTEICELISNYTGLDVVPWYEYDKNRVGILEPDFYLDTEEYEEKLNENYSPAGKEITPNKIVIHKSNPKFRDKISNEGLKAIAGECYKIYAGYGEKCIPAIFATNSTNKRSWFDSTYDDDVWEIDTEMIPDVKWYKDRHYESSKKHIVTFENIPADAITLKHEGTGKDWGLMESSKNKDMDNDIEKNLKVIRMLLKQISWGGLCDIWVEYNPVDKDYEIRSKSIKRHFDHDEIVNELNFVEESIKAMGLRPYVFSPWHVDNCEDEVKFMNESINKSDEKRNKIIEKIMDDIIFPEYNHIICGYDVKNDNVFNEPVVNVTFIGGYGTKLWPVTQGIQKMYRDILDEIWDTIYDYINIPVGVTMETTTKCNEKENIYLRESVDKSEDKKLKLVTKMIHEFFDEVSFIDIKKYENKPMIRVYFDNDEYAGNEETYFAEQIQDKIYEYTGIKLIPYWWDIPYDTDADFRLDAIKIKYDGEGNVINESEENKKEKKFNRLIQNVEDYLNSNEYPSVKRFTVYYEDTHDDVIVNIFFDAEEAVKLGGGINSVIKKTGKQVMSDLEIFPLDFKYYIHFDKGINESEEKQPKYLNIIKNLIEPFKKEDCVCDIRVTSEDDFYIIYLVFGTEELNDKFSSFLQRAEYTRNLRNNVKNTITDYLPINNLYVGSISKPNCKWKPMNESAFFRRRVDMSLMDKEFFEILNIITDVYLSKYNDGIDFNFETFKGHVIRYFMDGYYNDLTNGGENDYPVDEVYGYLSNHFHKKIKDIYDTHFGRNINESENKKQSLMELIDQYGLYAFLQTSGLDMIQISSALKNMDNPKEVLKQYIRDFILINGHKWGDNSGILSGYEIEVSDNKYVDEIEVIDVDLMSVKVFGLEYGHKEKKTSINALTNDELLTIIEWMAKTIKNGEWN